MIKKLVYIFIPILAVLLMSHNVHAFSITQSVDIKESINQPQVSYYDGSNWTSFTNVPQTFNDSNTNFTQMRLNKAPFTSFNEFTIGDFLVLNGYFSANQILRGDILETVGGFIGENNSGVSCPIIDLQFGAVQRYNQNNVSWYRADFQLTCKIIRNNWAGIQTINFRLRPDIFGSSGTRFIISFNTAVLAAPSSDINQEQEEATQDAADNSATYGNNSSTNSQNATSSLLSVITSGVGAITSASPTNCKINGNMGNLNVGNIDLCANPVPTFMALIGSIISVLVVLPLVILLFNRFISIIRSFQK